MSTINQLTAADTVVAADLVPIYASQNGMARKAAISTIAAYVQTLLTAANGYQTQYAAPGANGFSVIVNAVTEGASVYLLLTPLAGYTAGEIVLPALALCQDGQEVLVSCTQSVGVLTVFGNGAAAVNGAPAALTANGFFRLRYDGVYQSWFRVG